MSPMIVLIPAYEPDLALVSLVRELARHLPDATVVVVDDGSGPSYRELFDVVGDAGAHVLRVPLNRGKGVALKLGFAWAARHAPGQAVVCADCDGQHTPTDIARVAAHVEPGGIVLGGRRFTGEVPLRSRVGNTASRWVFRAVSGAAVHDTQTGLRGYPGELLPWLASVSGTRFEYEFNVLLGARAAGVRISEVPIETIYLDANAASHFRPVRDSLRIYAPLLRFAASSFAGYVVDVAGLLVLVAATGNLLLSVVAARLVSAALNFTVNRDLVFRHPGNRWEALTRYSTLAAALLGANMALMSLLVTAWGLPLLGAKVTVEAGLFLVSYALQHRMVFGAPGPETSGHAPGEPRASRRVVAPAPGPWPA